MSDTREESAWGGQRDDAPKEKKGEGREKAYEIKLPTRSRDSGKENYNCTFKTF